MESVSEVMLAVGLQTGVTTAVGSMLLRAAQAVWHCDLGQHCFGAHEVCLEGASHPDV